MFKWCVIRRESKTGHHKDMYLKDIRVPAQIMLYILGSIVNIMWEGGEEGG